MNCKQGDLAIIVNAHVDSVECIGRVVKCLRAGYDGVFGPTWLVSPVHDDWEQICDCYLKPLRDPGDEATDETLEWLPVPSAHVLKEAA